MRVVGKGSSSNQSAAAGRLLAVVRSSAVYQPVPERESDRRVMRIMDELYLKDRPSAAVRW